jgi:hypothetical protein
MNLDDLLEKLLSKKSLNSLEKTQLRKAFPLEKIESIILSLSHDKNNRSMTKKLYKAQNKLYPEKKPKKFRVVPTYGGNVVNKVISGGLPTLGKKR